MNNFVEDWVGYNGRDVAMLGHMLDDDPELKRQVETLACHFAKMVLWNLDRVLADKQTSAVVRYSAALGLMQGAAEGLALMDQQN